MKLSAFCLTLSALLIANSVTAQQVYFPPTDSWYQFVSAYDGWHGVNAAAAATSYLGRPGRLATINSQSENDFIVSLMPATGQGCWLGGVQSSGPEPAGGWEWISGEPWSFANWAAGEPNNAAGNEDVLEIYTAEGGGKWNDLRVDQPFYTSGYIIEYAPVPEPSLAGLMALGMALVAWKRKGS